MLQVICDICGTLHERSLDEAEFSCDRRMGAAMRAVDATPDTRAELINIVNRTGSAVLKAHPEVSGSVTPIFRHVYLLRPEVLDLLLIFFDRISLFVDSLDIEPSQRTAVTERLHAYSEAGFLIPFEFGRYNILRGRSINVDEHFKAQDSGVHVQRFSYYVQALSEITTQSDIRAATEIYR